MIQAGIVDPVRVTCSALRNAASVATLILTTETLIGDVVVGARSSVWFGAVVRGDVHHIRIGAETSVQDNAVLHVTHDRFPTLVGDRVTIGHAVKLHGCTVGDLCIIGMGATVLDQAEIGERSIIGAGALVTDELSRQMSSRSGVTELVVSEHDILDGIAQSIAE